MRRLRADALAKPLVEVAQGNMFVAAETWDGISLQRVLAGTTTIAWTRNVAPQGSRSPVVASGAANSALIAYQTGNGLVYFVRAF